MESKTTKSDLLKKVELLNEQIKKSNDLMIMFKCDYCEAVAYVAKTEQCSDVLARLKIKEWADSYAKGGITYVPQDINKGVSRLQPGAL